MRKTTVAAYLFILGVNGGMMSAIASAGDSLSEDDKAQAQKAIPLLQAQVGTAAEIKTLSVEKVTWPNGSLGCPKPGMNYTQALIEGYRVVLEANGRQYSYHGRQGGEPFYCANPGSSSSWIMDR